MTQLVLTPRGGAFLAAGLVTLFLAFYTLSLMLFVFAAFVIAFVAAEIFLFAYATRGFGPGAFRAQRLECSSFVPVNGTAFVAVRIVPTLKSGIYAEVFDSHPDRLTVVDGSPRLLTWWAPGAAKTLAYVTRPRVRGRFELGPTMVVAHDTFGFGFKEVALVTPWTLEAIPHYPSIRLRRPERFPTPTFGQSPHSARGAGMDFHSLREYVSTDDPRRIAWTRSGKGTMYVREFQRENQEEVVVLLDIGRAMAAGAGTADSLEEAVVAAGFAAQYAFDEDIRFGLILFSDRVVRHLPPGRGPEHEFEVARMLAGAEIEPRDSSLAGVFDYLVPLLTFPAHLLAFSSLEGDPAELGRAWGRLARSGHHLNVFAPDLKGIYPPLPSGSSQAALELLVRPEEERVDRQADGLRALGVPVARYGRSGATEGLNLVFAQIRGRRAAG
ncbi:MAG: DUF58 domain-containing protein [Thermoplasmata archaeon]|nr:DUF58 domain-containing protein [Thermoplasmata archaeon]